MLPNEVKPYTESYQWLWKHRKNYQEFRFNVMNMWVPDGVVDPAKKEIGDCRFCHERKCDGCPNPVHLDPRYQ